VVTILTLDGYCIPRIEGWPCGAGRPGTGIGKGTGIEPGVCSGMRSTSPGTEISSMEKFEVRVSAPVGSAVTETVGSAAASAHGLRHLSSPIHWSVMSSSFSYL